MLALPVTNMQRKAQRSNHDQAFPYAQLGTLALCRLAEPIALVSILPYAYPMVQHLGLGEPLHAGLWSGVLISSFSICEALVCPFWGALSDKIGRKPVLLIGMFGTMLSMLLMGFAGNYWFALIARCGGGILNGNIGVIQTIVGESCPNPDHQPRAFALMPTVWLLGTIIGPSIGAFGVGKVWPQRPYLLPNLVCAAILGLAIIIGSLLLKETNLELIGCHSFVDGPKASISKTTVSDDRSYGTFASKLRNFSEETLIGSGSEDNIPSTRKSKKTRPQLKETSSAESCEHIFTTRILLLFVALALYSYHNMCFDHLFPILLLDPRPLRLATTLPTGGLGLTQNQVGLVMSIRGTIALVIQILVMPPLTHRVGVFRLFQVSVLLHPFVYLLPPLMPTLLASTPGVLYTVMFAQLLIFNLAAIVLYPLILILIMDAVPRPSVLGKINGVAASCGAFARALAPPIAGWLHGVGEKSNVPGLAWYSTALVAALACVQMLMIQRTDNQECDDGDRPAWLLGDENVILSDDEDETEVRGEGLEYEESSSYRWQGHWEL